MMWMVWSVFAGMATTLPPGPALQVVRFDGNHEVSTAALQAIVQRLGAVLAGDDGPERLALAVTAVYFDHGFVSARVDEPQRARDGALVVHVSEGPRFFVRAVSFSGDWPRSVRALRALVQTRAGDAFNRARLVADLARLSAAVGGAAVTPLTRLDLDHRAVDVELALQR